MLRFSVVVLLVVLACSQKDDSPRGLCERGCKKLLDCAKAPSSEVAGCVDACVAGAPDKAQIEKLERTSCSELAGAGLGAPAAGTAPAAGACAADCRGCAGDNENCYAIAGGAHNIPCDPCCCAPGGPAPTWRTEE